MPSGLLAFLTFIDFSISCIPTVCNNKQSHGTPEKSRRVGRTIWGGISEKRELKRFAFSEGKLATDQ